MISDIMLMMDFELKISLHDKKTSGNTSKLNECCHFLN